MQAAFSSSLNPNYGIRLTGICCRPTRKVSACVEGRFWPENVTCDAKQGNVQTCTVASAKSISVQVCWHKASARLNVLGFMEAFLRNGGLGNFLASGLTEFPTHHCGLPERWVRTKFDG